MRNFLRALGIVFLTSLGVMAGTNNPGIIPLTGGPAQILFPVSCDSNGVVVAPTNFVKMAMSNAIGGTVAANMTNAGNKFTGAFIGTFPFASPTNAGVIDTNQIETISVQARNRARAGRTPLMGYNTWAHNGSSYNAAWVSNQVNIIYTNGFAAVGYKYFIHDDGSFTNRDGSGNLLINTNIFPNGLQYEADWLHSIGMRIGLYTEPRITTLGAFVGSDYAHAEQDCALFKTIGLDYLKLDLGQLHGATNEAVYAANRFAYALDTGTRHVLIDSGFGDTNYPASLNWARNLSALNSWRSVSPLNNLGPDGDTGVSSYFWNHTIKNFDVLFQQNSADYPSHIASAEYLEVDWNLPNQAKGAMALAAIAPSPLIWAQFPGPSDANYSQNSAYYKNLEAIAINQDSFVAPGVIVQSNGVSGGEDGNTPQGTQVIARPIGSFTFNGAPAYAVAVIERGSNVTATVTIGFTNFGIAAGTPMICRDIFNGTNCFATNTLTVSVGSQTAELWKLTPASTPVAATALVGSLPSSALPSSPVYSTVTAGTVISSNVVYYPTDLYSAAWAGVTIDNASESPIFLPQTLVIPKAATWSFGHFAPRWATNATVNVLFQWSGNAPLTYTNTIVGATYPDPGGRSIWQNAAQTVTLTNHYTWVSFPTRWSNGTQTSDNVPGVPRMWYLQSTISPTNTSAFIRVVQVNVSYVGVVDPNNQ